MVWRVDERVFFVVHWTPRPRQLLPDHAHANYDISARANLCSHGEFIQHSTAPTSEGPSRGMYAIINLFLLGGWPATATVLCFHRSAREACFTPGASSQSFGL